MRRIPRKGVPPNRFVDSKRWLVGKGQAVAKGMTVGRYLIFFAIGVYGGFLQAGVGIFLLAGLVLGAGYDVVRGNAVKVAIVLALTAAALIIFWAHSKVDWPIGLLMGVGNMIGAWVGTRFAADKGAVWVQRFVIAVVLASAAQLLGVFQWLAALLSAPCPPLAAADQVDCLHLSAFRDRGSGEIGTQHDLAVNLDHDHAEAEFQPIQQILDGHAGLPFDIVLVVDAYHLKRNRQA